MPSANMTSELKAYVSAYSMNSFFNATLSVMDEPTFWLNSTDAHNVTAGELERLIPGISAKYGNTTLMNIGVAPKNIEDVTVSEASQKMALSATVQLQFWLTNGTEVAALTLVDTDVEFTAMVTNMTLGLQLHKVNVASVTADYDTCGKLPARKLKIELNNAFRFGLPIINKLLAAHEIQIPTTVGPYLELSDVVTGYYDGYVALGVTPTFVNSTNTTAFLGATLPFIGAALPFM